MTDNYLHYRQQAIELVNPHVFNYKQYRCVDLTVARSLLGDEYYDRMMADKIKNLGPKPGTIYPWNVIDYLSFRLQDAGNEDIS